MNFDYRRTYMLYALKPRFLFLIDATVKRLHVFNEASHRFLWSALSYWKQRISSEFQSSSFKKFTTFVKLLTYIAVTDKSALGHSAGSLHAALDTVKKVLGLAPVLFVKFLSFVEIGQKIAFLEGFRAFFKKCYEFLDFASFDSFKEVTSFASILLVFHRKSSRSYLWIL